MLGSVCKIGYRLPYSCRPLFGIFPDCLLFRPYSNPMIQNSFTINTKYHRFPFLCTKSLCFPCTKNCTQKSYLDNHQPSELQTHIQDYPKTYITRTQSAWYFCMLNARHDWLSILIRKGTTTMISASKGANN